VRAESECRPFFTQSPGKSVEQATVPGGVDQGIDDVHASA
jgi:hypothetical protein